MKAVIFPGQGAQYTGMGKGFYDNFPQAKDIFCRIDDALGYKLSEKCFSGSADELKDTALQQLAILAVSVVAYEVFKTKRISVDYCAGLSLGEYSCLYAAEVVRLEDLVLLVKERAQAMQKAARMNSSTMFAVIGADRKSLEEKNEKEGFYIANINSPQQTVVSLSVDDKEKVKQLMESLAPRVVELEVSGGFHSPFMQPAKEHLQQVIDNLEFNDAKIPIVSNVTAKAHTAAGEIKDNLVEQLVSSVLWNDCVEFMAGQGVTDFYELGPSRVLRGLMRKINSSLKVTNVEKKEDIDNL